MKTATHTATASALVAAEMTLDLVIVIGRTPTGTPQIVCHGQNASNGLASLFAPVQPTNVLPAPTNVAKPVTVEPVKAPAANPTTDKAALLAEFKTLGGNHGLAAKWSVEAIQRNIDKLRATPKAAPTTTATVEKTTPTTNGKSGGGGKPAAGKGQMKKERHPLATSSKALILTKKGREMQVYVVKEIKSAKFTGFLVCNPDDDGVCDKWVYGAVWCIKPEQLLKWID